MPATSWSPDWSMALLGVAVIAGLWLPGLLGLVGVFYGLGAVEAAGASGWLFMPLCGSENVLALAALATVVLALGAVLTVWRQRPWPWLIGALTARSATAQPCTSRVRVHLRTARQRHQRAALCSAVTSVLAAFSSRA